MKVFTFTIDPCEIFHKDSKLPKTKFVKLSENSKSTKLHETVENSRSEFSKFSENFAQFTIIRQNHENACEFFHNPGGPLVKIFTRSEIGMIKN